ncbi:MAG: glycosyltransferase family 9 protein [Prosthecobacter sp.]|nr:glycosyltransferase family 9 protein [Prosthecobacter sp.]
MQPKKPRVLVIRGGAIGDFILTLPAIRLIRESIPGCHLEVLGYPGIVDLAVSAGLAEAVRSLEHRTMAPLFAKGAVIDEALVDYLCSFSLVVSYLYDPDGHLRASLERVGVKTLVECPHRVEPNKGHAAEQLAKPLEALAMYLDPEDWKRPMMAGSGMRTPGTSVRVGIHPGSGSEKKNWPLANWLLLGREILAEIPSARLVLITGEAEAERGVTEQLRLAWDGLPYDHWEGLPLTDLAARFSTCDVFVGHDSGISHLAATCGVPCVLLFGPTDPVLWAPPQPGVKVLRAPNGDLTHLMPDAVHAGLREALGR